MRRERPGAAGALALAVASGLAAVVAFPPLQLWPFGFVSAALLLLALAGQRPGLGFVLGFASAFVLQTLFGWWLFPAGVSAAAYFAGAVVCAAYAGVFGAGACWLTARSPGWAPLAIPSLWGVLEFLRANLGWLAAPWCALGYTQSGGRPELAGIAALAGVWGISFALMGTGVWLAALAPWRRPARLGPAGVVLAFALLVLLASGVVLSRRAAAPPSATLRVAVLQAGRHVPGRDTPAHALEVFERYRRLSREAAIEKPALIVWPESALPASLPADVAARAALSALAREVGAHLLVASSGRDKSKPAAADRWANSAFLFSPEGEMAARYDKIRLLPFNEYVPLRRLVAWPSWAAREMQDAEAGAERTVFHVGAARFAVLICWENLFGREFRASAAQGVDFMVSLSNEGFTEVGPGREQLFAMNALRAVENGVALARAATTGVSALIGPDGRELARVTDARGQALDSFGYAVQELPLTTSPTPYLRFGDWLVGVEAAILGAAALAAIKGARAA